MRYSNIAHYKVKQMHQPQDSRRLNYKPAGSDRKTSEFDSAGKHCEYLTGPVEVTPHPPSYLGHPLPEGGGCGKKSPPQIGRQSRIRQLPLPQM